MFTLLVTATTAQRNKLSLQAKKEAELMKLANYPAPMNDYVSAKEFTKGKKAYKMNKADETLAAWSLKADSEHNKKLKYNVDNVEDSLLVTCPTGFELCDGFNGDQAVYKHEHACCALDTRDKFEKCPSGSHFYEDQCWIPSKYDHTCPESHTRNGDKCIRYETTEPDELCPTDFKKKRDKYHKGKSICENETEVTEKICPESSFKDGDLCVVEIEEKPKCPRNYELEVVEQKYVCRREYVAACDMHVPHTKEQLLAEKPNYKSKLRKLQSSSPFSFDKGFSLNANVTKEDGKKYKNEFDDFKQSAHADAHKEHTMIKKYYDHIEKEAAFEKNMQKELHVELEKNMKDDLHYAEKALMALPKEEREKYEKLYSKIVKATCTYEDFAPVIRDVRRQVVEPTFETRMEVMKAPVTVVCPYGFARNKVTGECILFNEVPIKKNCLGVVVLGKCLEATPLVSYCEKPWIPRKTESGDLECIRTVFAPGLYTWLRDHTCFGDAKYCSALHRYIEHEKH